MRFLSILATSVIAAASCCNPNQKELTVVPYPNHVDIDCWLFNANGGYLPIETCYSFEPFTEDMTDEFNAIYDILGYNNGKHLFDAQGTTPVRYTLDGITGKGRPGFVFVDEILVN